MKCKKCKAELLDNTTVCPACGTDNAAAKDEKSSVTAKLTVVIVALVVLIAVLVGVIVMGMGGIGGGEDTTAAPDTTAATEADPTVPTDGNPDDETCKGTYTAAADVVLAAADEVVATMGEHKLTNGQLQVYYWMSVYNFLSYNSSYISYYGLDLAEGLDTQLCSVAEQGTWQQFFLAEALLAWQRYQALTIEAEAAQFQLEEQYAQDLENLQADLEAAMEQDGYESVQAMLDDQLGGGCTFEDYEKYMYQYYMGYLYYSAECEKITVTESEINAFFEENKDAYAEQGLTEDYLFYDVRHVLIEPEGGTTDESGITTYTDEEWEACRVKAQALLDDWRANDGTEEGFADLAKNHSADGNAEDGGIYTDLTTDTNFVEEFKSWYVDETRKSGDSGLVKSVYGYHLMYFVGSEPAWPAYAEGDLITTRENELLDHYVEKHPMEVDYSKILLGNVVLATAS